MTNKLYHKHSATVHYKCIGLQIIDTRTEVYTHRISHIFSVRVTVTSAKNKLGLSVDYAYIREGA